MTAAELFFSELKQNSLKKGFNMTWAHQLRFRFMNHAGQSYTQTGVWAGNFRPLPLSGAKDMSTVLRSDVVKFYSRDLSVSVTIQKT
jgi:hypothetical protein